MSVLVQCTVEFNHMKFHHFFEDWSHFFWIALKTFSKSWSTFSFQLHLLRGFHQLWVTILAKFLSIMIISLTLSHIIPPPLLQAESSSVNQSAPVYRSPTHTYPYHNTSSEMYSDGTKKNLRQIVFFGMPHSPEKCGKEKLNGIFWRCLRIPLRLSTSEDSL